MLARLGGSMAKGVADMNCLVTDKVRRTVKFLCAVAKGVPIVTTDWLEKVCTLSTHARSDELMQKYPHKPYIHTHTDVLKQTLLCSLCSRVVKLAASSHLIPLL